MRSYELSTQRVRSTFVHLAIVLLFAFPAGAQQWSWPEQPKNIQELPPEIGGQELRGVMLGFIRALGVSCSHCHVGKEGMPLTEWDFASDANPNKDRAREMLRMIRDINGHLAKIEPSGDQRVNVWCHTCHQGRSRPMTLEEELGAAYRASGIDEALRRYHALHEEYYGRAGYDFSPRSLNAFGYELLGKERTEDAITIFRLNASEHPDDGNVWDSLAEAYRKAGRPELARIYYRKSLEIDPENTNALEMLEELEASQP